MTVLMKKPNVLILDEPTNDLDLFTLQILEEFLVQFMGCVIIVSHDRFFTDKLVEHLFVFKGNGIIEDFPGNYTQFKIYERLQEDSIQKSEKIELQKPKAEKVIKGLTYKEKIELELIEKELEQLEQEKKIIEQELIVGTLSNAELIVKSERIGEIIQLIELKEIRWLELQEKL
jgi:ATP-binding cassette subfamily F protein uup